MATLLRDPGFRGLAGGLAALAATLAVDLHLARPAGGCGEAVPWFAIGYGLRIAGVALVATAWRRTRDMRASALAFGVLVASYFMPLLLGQAWATGNEAAIHALPYVLGGACALPLDRPRTAGPAWMAMLLSAAVVAYALWVNVTEPGFGCP